MKTGFYVGDLVRCVVSPHDAGMRIKEGFLGVVCHVEFERIGVAWDDAFGGHNCMGNCESGHGWYVCPECIECVDESECEQFSACMDDLYAMVRI